MAQKTLAELAPGESGVIVSVAGNGNVQHRLVDMGVVRGTRVTMVKSAPLGDPLEVKVKGFNLSLRRAEAAIITIEQ